MMITAGVVGYSVLRDLSAFGGNWSGFVVFGSYFAAGTHPPVGAIVLGGAASQGYDGQFYYLLAHDPLALHNATLRGLHGETFRALRTLYPAAADLVSHLTGASTSLSLLIVNVAVDLSLPAAFAYYCITCGWSPWWGLVLGLFPGFMLATLRDLTDPLATALVIGALIAWFHSKRWVAGVMLTGAVLAREVSMVIVLAVAVDAGRQAWLAKGAPGASRRMLLDALPVVAVPALIFCLMEAYIGMRTGGLVHEAQSTLPFGTFVHDLRANLTSDSGAFRSWDLLYETILVLSVGVALTVVWKAPDIFSIAAALFALALSVGAFEPVWSDTRDSLPLLALLLINGLRRGHGMSLALCIAAALTTIALPWIPGVLF